MDTRIITTGGALKELGELFAWSDELYLAYAWVKCTGPHWQAILGHLDKVQQAVIGVGFADTDPEALGAFDRAVPADENRGVKIGEPDLGTFHPKVILGISGHLGRALLGSSNLTHGGFMANVELNVLLSGTTAELKKIQDFIDDQWRRGTALTKARLDQYEKDHAEATRRGRPSTPRLTAIAADGPPPGAVEYTLRSRAGRARGYLTGDGREFVLRTESPVRKLDDAARKEAGVELLADYLNRLKVVGNHFELIADTAFPAPTTAGGFVVGARVGLARWVGADGRTLHDVLGKDDG